MVSIQVKPRSQHSLTGSRAEGPRGQGPRDTQIQRHTDKRDASQGWPKKANDIVTQGKQRTDKRLALDPESSVHPEGCPIPSIQHPKQV